MRQEVVVFTEGQSEELFIKRIVAPSLHPLNIYLKPLLLPTSKNAKGGAVSFERLKFNARNVLLGNKNVVLTTFLDLYALASDFPSYHEAKRITDVYARLEMLEQALSQAIISSMGCRPERFIAYIQPYELEGLFFPMSKPWCVRNPIGKKVWRHYKKCVQVFQPPNISMTVTKPSPLSV